MGRKYTCLINSQLFFNLKYNHFNLAVAEHSSIICNQTKLLSSLKKRD